MLRFISIISINQCTMPIIYREVFISFNANVKKNYFCFHIGVCSPNVKEES